MRPSALLYSKNLHLFCLSSSMTLQSVGIRIPLSFGSMMHMIGLLYRLWACYSPGYCPCKGLRWSRVFLWTPWSQYTGILCMFSPSFALCLVFQRCASASPKMATISWFRWNSDLQEDWCGYSGPTVSGRIGRCWWCRSGALHLGRWHLFRGWMSMMFCRSRMIESEYHCIHLIS